MREEVGITTTTHRGVGKQEKSRVDYLQAVDVYKTLGWVLIACIVFFFPLGGLACTYVCFVWLERCAAVVAETSFSQVVLSRRVPSSNCQSTEEKSRVYFEFLFSFTRQPGSFFSLSALGGRWRTSCKSWCCVVVVYTFPIISFRRSTPVMCVSMYIHTPMRGYRLK